MCYFFVQPNTVGLIRGVAACVKNGGGYADCHNNSKPPSSFQPLPVGNENL